MSLLEHPREKASHPAHSCRHHLLGCHHCLRVRFDNRGAKKGRWTLKNVSAHTSQVAMKQMPNTRPEAKTGATAFAMAKCEQMHQMGS